MHKYHLPNIPQSSGSALASDTPGYSLSSTSSYPPKTTLPTLERDGSSTALEPLIDDLDVVFDGDDELLKEGDQPDEPVRKVDKGKGRAKDEDAEGELVPYAHRDIKPG